MRRGGEKRGTQRRKDVMRRRGESGGSEVRRLRGSAFRDVDGACLAFIDHREISEDISSY